MTIKRLPCDGNGQANAQIDPNTPTSAIGSSAAKGVGQDWGGMRTSDRASNPTLEQEVLAVPQRPREARIHCHNEVDHLGRGVEVAEGTGWFARARHAAHVNQPILTGGAFALTEPAGGIEIVATHQRPVGSSIGHRAIWSDRTFREPIAP